MNANDNHTLDALWTVNTVTVTFNPNNGTVTPTSKQVTVGGNYGTLPTPTRGVGTGNCYRFDGWYTQQTGGTLVTAATKVTKSNNNTLYAKW